MTRYKDIGPWLAQLMLLAALTNSAAVPSRATTSMAPLGEVEVAWAFQGSGVSVKGGDPLETEVDPDPVHTSVCGDASLETKGGDPLKTEVDPDP